MIPTDIIDRIAGSEVTGHRLATLFFNMAEAVTQLNLPGGTLTLDFADSKDLIQPGDLIPQIHLTLKRVQESPPEAPQRPGYPAPETEMEPPPRLEDPYPEE